MRYAIIDTDTGRPYGPYDSPSESEALKNRPDLDSPVAVQLSEATPDDLSGLWGEQVEGVWTLVDRTDQGAAEDLAKAIKSARHALSDQINEFINTKTASEGGGNRYDQAWQTGALALKMDYQAALAAGGLTTEQETAINAALALIQSVQNWIYAVRAVLFAKRAEINAATDLAGVEAVTWDLGLFQVGATGTGANPDPDVYMDQLVIS